MAIKYAVRPFGGPVFYNDSGAYMTFINIPGIGIQDAFVIAGSLNIDNAIGKRSEASFTLRTATLTNFQQYQQVLIYDETLTLVFSGYIMKPKEMPYGFSFSLIHNITCVDQHFLADKRRITATYTNKTAGYIVQQILNDILADEGVKRGQIYDGLTPSDTLYPADDLYPGGNVGLIPQVVFVYAKVSEALDALAKAASAAGVPYYWQIDALKELYFVPYTAIVNSTIVDGSQIDDRSLPSLTRSNPNYRNQQIVLGGTAETVSQVETRKGDGETTAWPMKYALSRVPTVKVNTVVKTVGIRGVDSDTAFDFYWSKGEHEISQKNGATKLISTDTLEVTYVGQYASVVISKNSAQVTEQATLDGTSGIIEEVETDSTLTTLEDALQMASSRLTLYAVRGKIYEFKTKQSGFSQGQLITIDQVRHSINSEQFLVESVHADDSDGLNIYWTVKALQGPAESTWQDFFGSLWKSRQPATAINIGVTQTVTILEQFIGSIALSGVFTPNAYACPFPSSTTWPDSTLYPC